MRSRRRPYDCDALNRLQTVNAACGSQYQYLQNEIGNLTKMQEGNFDWTLDYSDAQHPHAVKNVVMGGNNVISYQYDANGNVIRKTNADTDHDRCPDKNELQTAVGSQTSGGLRNPNSRWDWMDPTKDGMNRVNDILWVVQRFYQTDAESVDEADRGLGRQRRNTTQGDGKIRVNDILNAVHFFHNDCPLAADTTLTYDPEHRLISQATSLAGGNSNSTSYVYDGQGTLVRKIATTTVGTSTTTAATTYMSDLYETTTSGSSTSAVKVLPLRRPSSCQEQRFDFVPARR